MAKKSNKTEHVLKLITKNDDAAQDEDFFVIDQEIREPKIEIKAAVVQIVTEPQRSEVLEAVPQAIPAAVEPAAELPVAEPPAAAPQEAPMAKAFREQESAGSAIPEQNEDLVNIAEILAKEKLGLVMERMKVCSCKTCVNDVLALALNSLPTKYVTTDAGRQFFQLDGYKKKYETEILAALTKACVRVKAAPRHES